MREKGEGIKKYKLPVVKTVMVGGKHSTGSTVDGVVKMITVSDGHWSHQGDCFLCYIMSDHYVVHPKLT